MEAAEGPLAAEARMQPWFMQGDTGAAAGHACCWDYTAAAAAGITRN